MAAQIVRRCCLQRFRAVPRRADLIREIGSAEPTDMSEGAVRCGARRIDAHVVLVGKDPISLATETGRAAVPGPEDGSEVTLEGTPRCYTGSDVHEHGWDYIVSVGYVGCGSSRTDLACGRGHVTENCCCCCC